MSVVLCAAAALAGCAPGNGRDDPPPLTLDPGSALQGVVLVVNMSAEGVRFDECGNLDDPATAIGAVVFTSPGGSTGGVTVYDVQPASAWTLRAQIAVAATAEPGDYQVQVQCGTAAPLGGSFRVRERKGDPDLSLSPGAAAAGTTNLSVELLIEGGQFVPDATHVVFGSGTFVAVKEQVYQGATEMTVVIDVAPGAPPGELEVTATAGGLVARGSFVIEEKIYPTIQAFPDSVWRPAAGEPAAQATLMVVGSGVNFSAGGEDTDEEPGTQVGFPDNPGITVTATVVNSADTLTVNILVDPLAVPGPTPLTVTTGEEIATTDFTVLVTPDTPVLTIHPSHIVRGAEASLFLVQATNFSFEEPLEVAFAGAGCQVEGFEVLPSAGLPQAMAVQAAADADVEAAGNILAITSGTESVAVHLAVTDPDQVILASPDPSVFTQGGIGFTVLRFQGAGSFSPAARAEVLPRSGLGIPYQSPAVDGTSLTLQLAVAADAPVGPALLRVTDGGEVHETFLGVAPSGLVPTVSLSPKLVLPGRRTIVLEAAATGIDFTAGPVTVAFDDPALRVSSIEVVDPSSLKATVEVAPTAREDVAVAYFADGDGARAATALRELPAQHAVAVAAPGDVYRGVAGDQVVQVSAPGAGFGATVAQVADGLGLDVRRVTVHGPEALELALELEAFGPGGWIGVLLKTGSRQVVVPVHLVGDDESLTLHLSSAEIRPGSNAAPVTATIPSGCSGLDPIFTTAAAGTAGAFAAVSQVPGPQQALLLLDVSHDVLPGPAGLPVLVTATKGAYVGLLAVASLPTGTASEDVPWQGTLTAGEIRLVTVDPGVPPAALLPGLGSPDHADLAASLIDDGGLLAVAGSPPDGLLWVTSGSTATVAVEAVGDPAGTASILSVRAIGDGAVELAEPDDTAATALPVGNPCDAPVLVSGIIGQGLDVDRVRLGAASCDLAAVMVARALAPRPWDTPDCRLERRSAADALLASETGGLLADPRLFAAGAEDGEQLVVAGELGTTGGYLLNVRRAAVIGEICLAADGPFIELSVPPGAALDSLTLELLDGDSGLVLASLELTGQSAPASGVFVVGGAAMTGADLTHAVAELPDTGSFALRLRTGGEVLDAIQVGGDGAHGEGDPLDRDEGTCFFRPGTIDTDRNRVDLLPVWIGTPGEE